MPVKTISSIEYLLQVFGFYFGNWKALTMVQFGNILLQYQGMNDLAEPQLNQLN